jgi:hypothetical protein
MSGWVALVRRPHRVLTVAVAGLAFLALLLVPAMLAADVGWDRLRRLLVGGQDLPVVLVGVAVWVATWLGALVLAGVGAAVRAALWTLESATAGGPPSPV